MSRSVPALRRKLPRDLTPQEIEGAERIADVLCAGPSHQVARPSECVEFPDQLVICVAARIDVFDQLVDAFARAATAEDVERWVRALNDTEPEAFAFVSAVVGGAYLMVPEIQAYVGYPGQGRHPAPPTQIGDELSGGLLDPVIERGPIFKVP
jgi:hypothetical protein